MNFLLLGRRCDCGKDFEAESDFAESEPLVTHVFNLNHTLDHSLAFA